MNRFFTTVFLFSIVLAMSGCSSIKSLLDWDRESPEELEEKRLKELELPPEFSRMEVNDSMAIPGALRGNASYSSMAKRKQINDAISGTGDSNVSGTFNNDRVKFLRSGDAMWLQVKADQGGAYSKIKAFFENQEYPIEREEKALSIIETEWMADTNAIPQGFLKGITALFGAPVKEKFRSRIEIGEKAGTVEIFITRYAVERVLVDEIESGNVIFEKNVGAGNSSTKSRSWKPMASDPAVESEILKRFVVFLGYDDQAIEKVVEQAEEKPQSTRFFAATETEPAYLLVNERFFTAWRLVGIAIDRASYTLDDRDRTEGKYYVRYDRSAETSEEKGFWASLVFWKDDDESIGIDNFIFKVEDNGGSCKVTVLPNGENEISPALVEKVLKLLDEQFY